MSAETLLMVADSDRDANMLYAVGMFVPDPFVYLRIEGKGHIVLNDLELDRARASVKRCNVLSLSHYQEKLRKSGVKSPTQCRVIREILREHDVNKVFVPADFPLGLAKQLKDLRVKIKVKEDPFFAERERKAEEEVKKISAAIMMAEVGLAEGIQVLKHAKVGKRGQLVYNGNPLSSEKLRAVIDIAILQAGGVSSHTIVACGKQGCDPHEQGHGPLRANQLIILDVFPRSQKTGYCGDITRTVYKGRPNESARRLYNTVARGQEIAFENIVEGKTGVEVHESVADFFEREGFKSGKIDGRMQGFFHGTGHGLGLEVHELPRLGPNSKDTLMAGHVVTVEPGLYYPEIGGVRLEDVALVTKGKPRNLTKFEKLLEV